MPLGENEDRRESAAGSAPRLRRAPGDGDAALYVDANGALSCKQALLFADRFAGLGVRWFEEPVSSDDLRGLLHVRERAPAGMDIAAGEYGYTPDYFRRMLEAEAVDMQQADASRCLGITGFLQALCASRHIDLSGLRAVASPARRLRRTAVPQPRMVSRPCARRDAVQRRAGSAQRHDRAGPEPPWPRFGVQGAGRGTVCRLTFAASPMLLRVPACRAPPPDGRSGGGSCRGPSSASAVR